MTPRQAQITKVFKACGSKAETARQLGISVSSVKTHLRRAGVADAPDPIASHQENVERKAAQAQINELTRRLADAERRQGLHNALSAPLHVPKINAREISSGLREATMVVLASDWHVEETVFPEQVAGVNEYNLIVAEDRIRRFFEGIRWLLKHHRQSFLVRDMLLWLGGDLITGYIHEELEESNGLSPFEACHWLKGRLIAGIDYLLEDPELETLIIPCSFGNHGRVHKRKRIKTGAQNSYEWALYVDLADRYAKNPRVKFVVDKSAHQYVDLYGFRWHGHHGDDVRYAGGVGGVSIPLNKRVAQWDRIRRCDFHNVGHFHQYLDGGSWMVNGSLI